jgi:hypothetical protein
MNKKLKNVRAMLIEAGVKNMREFGYPDCNSKNIFTDLIYRGFFKVMLADNLGKGFDTDIKSLQKEIGD